MVLSKAGRVHTTNSFKGRQNIVMKAKVLSDKVYYTLAVEVSIKIKVSSTFALIKTSAEHLYL